MAYHVDEVNGDIVIDGFQNGIGDNPYTGLTDIRNVNATSSVGEVTVGFATQQISNKSVSGTISSVSGTVATYTTTSTSAVMENNLAVYLVGLGSVAGGSQATPYWIQNLTGTTSGTFTLSTSYSGTVSGSPSLVNFVSGTNATFTAYQVGIAPSYISSPTNPSSATNGGIQHFAQPTNPKMHNVSGNIAYTYGIDNIGLVWGNRITTGTNNYWVYTGNRITNVASGVDNGTSISSGNGLAYWRVSNNNQAGSAQIADILIAFRNSAIDMMPLFTAGSGAPLNNSFFSNLNTWNYNWQQSVGLFTNSNFTGSYLTAYSDQNISHQAIIAPDGRLYFCDVNNIQKLFQTASTAIFNPLDTTSYTYTTFPLLPTTDIAQCLAPSGVNILIGGQGYNLYSWNTTASAVNYPIPIAEPFIAKMVTVNVNTYIFAGNQGAIYVTNGSQANFWKKIPDYLTGTTKSAFYWGGATASLNQLYFSFLAVQADGSTGLANPIGGLWCADLASGILQMKCQLSYGTYAGFASALMPIIYNPVANYTPPSIDPMLYIGWSDGTGSSFGVDRPTATVYTGGQSYVTSDMIPIGTLLRPTTAAQVEFKLAKPLLSTESVSVYQGSYFDMSYASFATLGTVTGSTTATILSGNFPIQQQNQQWCLVRVVLTGRSNNPSFNRLTQLRIIGATHRQTSLSQVQ